MGGAGCAAEQCVHARLARPFRRLCRGREVIIRRKHGLPMPARLAHPRVMGTKSRETIFGSSIRAATERAVATRKEADRLAGEAWSKRMLGYCGPAKPSPTSRAEQRSLLRLGNRPLH